MQRPELVAQILDYIKTLYKAEYKGFIEVDQLLTVYKFKMGIPSYMVPTVNIYEANSDDDFLAYIYEELRTRNYMRLDIYKTDRTNDTREE